MVQQCILLAHLRGGLLSERTVLLCLSGQDQGSLDDGLQVRVHDAHRLVCAAAEQLEPRPEPDKTRAMRDLVLRVPECLHELVCGRERPVITKMRRRVLRVG